MTKILFEAPDLTMGFTDASPLVSTTLVFNKDTKHVYLGIHYTYLCRVGNRVFKKTDNKESITLKGGKMYGSLSRDVTTRYAQHILGLFFSEEDLEHIPAGIADMLYCKAVLKGLIRGKITTFEQLRITYWKAVGINPDLGETYVRECTNYPYPLSANGVSIFDIRDFSENPMEDIVVVANAREISIYQQLLEMAFLLHCKVSLQGTQEELVTRREQLVNTYAQQNHFDDTPYYKVDTKKIGNYTILNSDAALMCRPWEVRYFNNLDNIKDGDYLVIVLPNGETHHIGYAQCKASPDYLPEALKEIVKTDGDYLQSRLDVARKLATLRRAAQHAMGLPPGNDLPW